MKIQKWRKYPRTDLKRERSYPFCMVWSYLPGGIEIFTGDIFTIREHLSSYPTHHASVTRISRSSYSYKIKYIDQRYDVFGEFSRDNYLRGKNVDFYFYIDTVLPGRYRPNPHARFVLIKRDPYNEDEYIRAFRRLPKRHLKEFK